MRHIEISRKTARFSDQSERTLVYYVTADELPGRGGCLGLEIYGVGVTILENGETEIIPDVSFSKDAVIALAELLAHHLVTPVTVGDVVSDWICA